MTTAAEANLNRILECPICLEEFGKKEIYQCPEGHVVCANCIGGCKKSCPTCRAKMPRKRVRNRALEFVASNSGTIVTLPKASVTSDPAGTTEPLRKKCKVSTAVHDATCDGPACKHKHDERITGIRYKCTQCPDFDVCESCLLNGVHKDHVFLRFTSQAQFEKHYAQTKTKSTAVPAGTTASNSGSINTRSMTRSHVYA